MATIKECHLGLLHRLVILNGLKKYMAHYCEVAKFIYRTECLYYIEKEFKTVKHKKTEY